MKFTSPDQVLRRWAQLHERLSSPRASSGVLMSGLRYDKRCEHCGGTEWVEKAEGRPPNRTYHAVCARERCRKPWGVSMADVRAGTIQSGSTRGDHAHSDLAILVRLIRAVPAWPRKTWSLWVLGQLAQYEAKAEQMFGETSSHALLAAGCALRWKAKHASERGGFFTPRYVRTLVAQARRDTEARLRRNRLWDPKFDCPQPQEEAPIR